MTQAEARQAARSMSAGDALAVATTVRSNGRGGWIHGGWPDKTSIWVVASVPAPGSQPTAILAGV